MRVLFRPSRLRGRTTVRSHISITTYDYAHEHEHDRTFLVDTQQRPWLAWPVDMRVGTLYNSADAG